MNLSREMCVSLRDVYCTQLEGEQKTFLNVVKAMPDDHLKYKPHDKIMDFGTLARHVSSSGQFFVKVIEAGQVEMGGDQPEAPPLPKTTKALCAEIEAMFSNTMQAFKGFDVEKLVRPINFFGMGEYPGVHYINWDVVHLIHHRAQLGMYLRLAGQKVPSVYGPTADVTFEDMMASK